MNGTKYDGDPRIEWAEPDRFYLPDHHADLWNVGDRWTVESERWFGRIRWNVYDPDGRFYREASYKKHFDDALEALIGPPLWDLEAEILLEALDSDGWLPCGCCHDTDDLDAGPAGAAALDNLKDGGCFDLHVVDKHVDGYILTERGRILAGQIAGRSDPEVHRLIITNVPQTWSYGVSETADENEHEGAPT